MIQWVQHKHKIGRNTNLTFLSLITKELIATSFNHVIPISFCSSSDKIITKILANCLKIPFPHLISENQGGYVPNWQIDDNIILVKEAIHSSIYREDQGFVLKLDMENDFDRVRHSFLFVVLDKLGFSMDFIDLIKSCIHRPWITPLINGKPRKFFQSSRGLRKCFPISPFL